MPPLRTTGHARFERRKIVSEKEYSNIEKCRKDSPTEWLQSANQRQYLSHKKGNGMICQLLPLPSFVKLTAMQKNRSMEIVSELIREVVDTIAHNKPPSMLRRVIEKPVTCADPKTFHFPRIAAGAICFCFISYLYHYRFIQKYGNFPIERNNVSFLSLRNDL